MQCSEVHNAVTKLLQLGHVYHNGELNYYVRKNTIYQENFYSL